MLIISQQTSTVWGLGELAAATIFIIKPTDESKSNDIVKAPDSALQVNLDANSVYFFQLFLRVNAPAPERIEYEFSLPSGASGRIFTQVWRGDGEQGTDDITTFIQDLGTQPDSVITYYGFLEIGGTAGVFSFDWAQKISGPSVTTVQKGSALLLWKA